MRHKQMYIEPNSDERITNVTNVVYQTLSHHGSQNHRVIQCKKKIFSVENTVVELRHLSKWTKQEIW